jgi:cellulase/cellobiase CelA1
MVTKGKISGKTYQKIKAQNPTQSINPTHIISVIVLPSIVSVQTGDRTAAAACTGTKLNGLAHCHNPFLETFGKRKEGDSSE